MFKKEIMLQKLEDFREKRFDVVNLPCNKCNGDCCSASVPFTKEELNSIQKELPGLFKKYKLIKTDIPDTFTLQQKGKITNKCVFYKNSKCSIYKARPRICKDFGEKLYSPCAFNNLKEIPKSKEEQDRLAEKCQIEAFEKMKEFSGVISNINIYSKKFKNVLR